MSGGTKIGYEVNELRVCFLKKIQDWILKFKKKRILHFFTKQINSR